jgi:hypothetical protein
VLLGFNANIVTHLQPTSKHQEKNTLKIKHKQVERKMAKNKRNVGRN